MPDTPEKDKPQSPPAPPAASPPAKPKLTPVEEALRRKVESKALDRLKEVYPDDVLEIVCYAGEVTVVVPREKIATILEFLRDDEVTAFNLLADQTAGDYPEREKRFDVVYHLYSIPLNHRLRVKIHVGEAEQVPTAALIFQAANWAEREIFDLFGIHFEGHPDMRRILLPDEWKGHPLRKEFPLEGFPEQHMRLR